MPIPIESSQDAQAKRPGCSRFAFFLFAVLLPIVTLVTETATHMCGESFFDPIPSLFHIALIALVPVANILIWRAATQENLSHPNRWQFLNGTALGTSLYYTLTFLPLSIIAIPAVLAYGIGLLPLAPIMSLVGALFCRQLLTKRSLSQKNKLIWLGAFCTFAMLLLAELPSAATYSAMTGAKEGKASSLRFLRSWGAEDYVLKACYMSPSKGLLLLAYPTGWINGPLSHLDARKLYYRMTGVPFNAVPPPDFLKDDLMRWNFDPEQGGEKVGGRLSSLFLEESSILCSTYPKSSLVYTEWTLVFRNDHISESTEARTQLILPPGAVISRATLWVNGKEKEAAFATREEARNAYERVVRRSQDPLLVTTYGPDRALVQCFPVQPGGGKMRIRIGITAPLHLTSATEGILPLPKIAERNFNLEHDHQLKVVGDFPVAGSVSLEDGRAQLTDEQISDPSAHLALQRPATALFHAPLKDERLVVAKLEQVQDPKPSFIFVVDGSLSAKPFASEIAAALPKSAKIVFGGDESQEVALEELVAQDFAGGQDGVSALEEALQIASDKDEIVWFSTSQPLELFSTKELREQIKSRPEMKLHNFALETGPNRVLESLDGLDQLQTVVRSGSVKDDLTNFLNSNKHWEVVLERSSEASGETGSEHLARLWAADKSEQLWAQGKTQEAAKIAVKYQLVTPASGAVVLETKEQYDEAGLEPVAPGTVPTIPEPEIWLLLFVGLGLMASMRKIKLA